MSRTATTALAAIVLCYWSIPVGSFGSEPLPRGPLDISTFERPFERWCLQPASAPRLCVTDEPYRSGPDSDTSEVRPAWLLFALIAGWSIMLIMDPSHRAASKTVSFIQHATPIGLIVFSVLAYVVHTRDNNTTS